MTNGSYYIFSSNTYFFLIFKSHLLVRDSFQRDSLTRFFDDSSLLMGGLCSIAIEFKIFDMMLSCSIFKKKQIHGGTFSYHNAIAKC
jgi:hypothetical protein